MRLRALAIGTAAWALACGAPSEHPGASPMGSSSAGTAGNAAALAGAGAGGVTGGASLAGGASGVGGALGIAGAQDVGGFSPSGGSAGAGGVGGAGSAGAASAGAAAAEPMPDARFDAAWAVLKPRCGECHGDEAERFGGQDRQKAFTAALIYANEMQRRLHLPRSSRDVMPPRRALSATELATIDTWLASR